MAWVATAVIGGAVIGAIGSNISANKQAGAQKQAAQTQSDMYKKTTANEQPYMDAGYGATDSLSQLMGQSGKTAMVGNTGLQNGYLTQTFDPNSLEGNAAYQFAKQQGGSAVSNSFSASGSGIGSNAARALSTFNVGNANQFEKQYFDQFQQERNNIYDRLSGVANRGQSAAAGVGNVGATLGTGIAQAQAGAGASQAAGIVGATNAFSGAANTGAGMMYLNANGGGGSPYMGSPSNTNPQGYYAQNGSDVGITLAEGGPVRKYAMGGAVLDNPETMGGMGRFMQPNYGVPQAFASPAQQQPNWGAPQQMTNGPQAPPQAQPQAQPQAPQPQPQLQMQQAQQEAPQAQTAPAVSGQPLNHIMNGIQSPELQPQSPQQAPSRMGIGDTAGGWEMPQQPQHQPLHQMMQPHQGARGFNGYGGGRYAQAAMNEGGEVAGPGGPKDDQIPAMLSDGEHVMDAASVDAFGGGNNERGQQKLNTLRELMKRRA